VDANEHLKLIVGDLIFQIASLQAENEELRGKVPQIVELKGEPSAPPVPLKE